MEANKESAGLLDLLLRPGFSVTESIITQTNQSARELLLLPGTDVRTLLLTGQEEYAAFHGGCLYLTLNLSAGGCGACVLRIGEQDLFILDQESDDDALRALSLAARELRGPLTGMMLSASQLAPVLRQEDTATEQLARLNRSIHQMLRLIGNMADAGRTSAASHMEVQNIRQVFLEIFETANSILSRTGLALTYEGLEQDLLCLADRDALERAVLNLLSNAAKFTPKGGFVHVRLSRRDRMLHLSITDSGSGIANGLQSSLYHRYLRQPGIEDSRFGIGLGMVLVRNTAKAHGGTVLIDQPDGAGTRVTMTLAIRQNSSANLRCPVMRVDYSGGQDHALVELSNCLPLECYE